MKVELVVQYQTCLLLMGSIMILVVSSSVAVTSFPQHANSIFSAFIAEISVNKSHVWNSLEIQNAYVSHGGSILQRRNLIDRLLNHFGEDLLVLSGNGVASLLVFRRKAFHLLKLVDDNDETHCKHNQERVCRKII